METGIARNASLTSAALQNAAGEFVDPVTASINSPASLAVPLPTDVASPAWEGLTFEASCEPLRLHAFAMDSQRFSISDHSTWQLLVLALIVGRAARA